MSRITVALAALFLICATIFAQVTGRLTGTVVDPASAAVPGAKVGIYLPSGKSPLLATTTNHEGIFDFVGVRPGFYLVVIESEGFTKYTQANVKIDAARQLALPPITLALASSTQMVEVTASTAAIDTATAEISSTVTNEQMYEVPVLSRQIVGLFNMVTGVVQNNRTATVINGMRPSYSNVMYDGVNVQDTVRTNDLDLLSNRFTLGQVAEMTVSTSNASPTIGGGSSTIVLVSPSGTDLLHGSGYWANRNNFFAASDWFNNKNGIKRPFLNLNQVGGTLGGAVIKDKLFFYGVYEAYRLKQQSPKTLTIPTANARQGILTYLVSGQQQTFDVLKASNLTASPFVKNLLSQVPLVGNNAAVGDNLNTTGYTYNARANGTRDNLTGKVDYNHSTKHVFAGSYSWNRAVTDRNDGSYYSPVPPTYNNNRGNLVSTSWRWTPTANLTNEVRGGFNYYNAPFVVRQPQQPYYVTGFFFNSPIETAELGEGRTNHQYNIQDNAQWVHGKHSVSFGFQAALVTAAAYNYNGSASTNTVFPLYTIGISAASPFGFNTGEIPGANSTFTNTGNNILASIAGLASQAGQYFNVTSRSSGFVPGAPQITNQRFNQFALYALDNFKVNHKLTLTLGLRWDYFAPVTETDGLAITPHLINNNPVTTLLGNATIDFSGTSDYPFYKRDLNNFAPNLALAYTPFGDGKTVIRAGYSVAYLNDNHLNSVYNTVMSPNSGLSTAIQPANLTARVDTAPVIPIPKFGIPTTTLTNYINNGPSSPGTEGIANSDLATPYVQQWTVGVQHETKGWIFEGRYVGNHAVKMLRGIDFNQVNINVQGLLPDFIRARNNGFLALAKNGTFLPAYNPAIAGSQPLTYLNTLPNIPGTTATVLTSSSFLTSLRSGEVGSFAQSIQSNFPFNTANSLGYSFFPNPYLLYATELSNLSSGNYHGAQFELHKRAHNGAFFQVSYVYSRVLTDSNALRGLDPVLDNASPKVEKARADFDLTHSFKVIHYYPLPIGSGHRFGSSNPVLKQVLDGWALGGFGVIQTGSPVSVFSARGTLNRAARSGNNTVDTTDNLAQLHADTGLIMTGNGPYWIDPSHIGADTRGIAADGSAPFAGQIFFNPQPGTQGSLQKRALDGPPFRSYDFSAVKHFKITERQTLEFRTDFFNIFNHANFFVSQGTSSDYNVNTTGFGRITAQNYQNNGVGPRVIQFQLFYRF